MNTSYTFKIGGPAGLGIMTSGLMFSKVATRSGFHIFGYPEYPSLIRGGHNVMEVRFGPDEVFAQERGVDLLVALNKETIDLHRKELKEGSGILYDPDICKIDQSEFANSGIALIPIPLKKITEETGIMKVMENNVTLGAATALFNLPRESVFSVIEDIFSRKGDEVVAENRKAAEAGMDYISKQGFKLDAYARAPLEASATVRKDKAVMTGNEALGFGALMGGCQFYVAYPMTPSSAILHYLASKAQKAGIVVRHAEDEIGVINEALGASFAGARSMVGTSGGGFALMNEAISLSGVTETPIVVVLGQRPGPATGLPTWTEQAELQYAIRAGHGEFPKIVLAAGDIEEAYVLAAEALNLADIYQCPVVLLTDKYMAESYKSIELAKLKAHDTPIDRGRLELKQHEGEMRVFERYADSPDGISTRIIPGQKGSYFQANSYEHVADGHTTEDAKERIIQVDKRGRKMITYLNTFFKGPQLYGPEKAAITFIGWGGVRGPILEALKEVGDRVNYLHFTHMWPMDQVKIAEVLRKHERLVLVENNSTGQFGQLIRQETGISVYQKLLKYDGRPFYPEEIVAYVKAHS